MCDDRLYEEIKRVSLLQNTGSRCGKEPTGKHFAIFRLIAEADLAPLDSWTHGPLSSVVGGFNPFVFQESEKAVPVLEEALRHSSHIRVRAAQILLKAPAHASANGNRLADKGIPIQMSAPESL